MNLLSMNISSVTISFLPLRHKKFAQHYMLNNLIQCFSINVRYRDSHPYKTIGTTVAVYILIFMFLDFKWKHKRSHSKQQQQTFLVFNLHLIYSYIQF
jgi:hypothetical protein